MRDPRSALAHVLTTPLAINEQWIELFKGYAANPKSFFEAVSDSKQEPRTSDVPGVNIINVSGPLSKDTDAWAWIFGGTSYQGIKEELDKALSTGLPTVLRFDTPGGDVYGCDELAEYIREQRAQGAVIDAYIEGQGDSAGYYLASACGKITINASGEAGSIGVRCVLVDASKYEEQLGIKVIDVVADQSPLKVIDASDPKDVERVKQQMTAFASVFIEAVAKGRGVSVATVTSKFGKGDVMVGQAAVSAGLADEVGTLGSVIAALATNHKENKMKTTTTSAANAAPLPVAGVNNGKCSDCDKDMDDDDPMYCKACKGSSKASGFVASVMALLGASDEADAVGRIAGLKAQASKVEALEAQISAQLKAQAQSEAKALLDAACADGRVTPSAREDFEAVYAEYGIKALSAALKPLKPAASPAIPATDAQAREAAEKNVAAAPPVVQAAQFSAEQLEVFRVTGITPEQYHAQKAALAKHVSGQK